MGRRVASMVADTLLDSGGIRGLLCLGNPFHPSAPQAGAIAYRPPCWSEDLDPRREEVLSYNLSPLSYILWLEDGDPNLKPRKW